MPKQLPSLLKERPARPRKAKSARAPKPARATPPTPERPVKPDSSQVMVVIQARRVDVVNGQETWVPLELHDLPLSTLADLSKAAATLAGIHLRHGDHTEAHDPA